MKRIVALGTAAFLLVAGCSNSSKDDAAFKEVKSVLESSANGDYAAVWEQLFPPIQQKVDAALFAQCMADAAPPPSEEGIDVGLVATDAKTATVVGEKVDVVAVTVSVKSTPDGETENATETYDVVKDGDNYFWTLKQDAITSYEAGNCPES